MSKYFKVILVGEPGVGKTSIQRNYFGKNFDYNYIPTLGVDFASKKVNNRFLQIWDLAGQSDYQKLRASYFVGANGVVIVFDITNPDSLSSINYWISEVETNLDSKIPICIVANKIDLRTDEEHYIVEENAKEVILPALFSYGANYLYFETSAKTGENIDLMFKNMLEQILVT